MTRRTSILYVSHTGAWGGGGEASLLQLMQAARAEGFALYLIGPDGPLLDRAGPLCDGVYRADFPWLRRTRNPLTVAALLARVPVTWALLLRAIARSHIDIMHANSGVAALVACVPGLLTGTPVIWHQRDIVPPRRINRLVLGLCGRLASAVVGTSGAVADSLAAIGVQRHKLRVIYPRIDDRFFEPLPPQREARKSLGIPEEGLMLTVLGRLVPHKGQHVFLEMLSHLRSRGQDVYGLLVGHLPSEPGADDALAAYVSALERAAGEPQLQGRVSFLGRRDDVPTVLAASDLLVVPSTAEPFGRVIIEAFAAGVPVIASRSGGPLEIIEDRVTGMLVPVGDAGAFADAAYHLLSDPQAREAMVSHARDQAWARFSMAGLRDDVGRLYRSLSVPVPVRETVQREA